MRLSAAILLLLAAASFAAPIDDRMSIVEAIDAVRERGHRITYSTQLVKPWMRVRETPTDDDAIDALSAALAAYGLGLEPGADGGWLIVRGEFEQPAAPPPASAVVAATAAKPPAPRPLEEITVVASRHSLYADDRADQFLSGEEIRLMPHIADDAFRAFHRLPGVAASDFQAPFNLRGGARDEVLIELNGVEIIEPFHMRTLFQPLSVIDPGIIGEAEVLSGGFTARHGNYMSGVIDISTEIPEGEPLHEVGVSFVSAFARSRGEWLDRRGSYFVSARRGYLDLIADRVVSEGEELQPRYGDLYANFGYVLNDTVHLSLQTLLAEDDVVFTDPEDGEDFGETSSMRYVWLTADTEFASGIHARHSVFAGRNHSTEDGGQVNPPSEQIARYFDRRIESAGIRTDWVFPLSDVHLFAAGARYRDLSADFDYRLDAVRRNDFVNNGAPFAVQRDIVTASRGEDMGAYAAYRRRSFERLVWELGVRWDRQTYGEPDDQWSPRINGTYLLNERAEIRFAWGRYYQPQAIQNLEVPDDDLTYYAAERAEHTVIGLRYELRTGLELQADLYDKRYDNLRPRYENLLDVYEFAPESNFDRVRVHPVDGRAYGAELTLRSRGESPLDWWLNYTWSKAEDTIDGESIPRSWDQRHAVTANVAWRGDRWSVSAVGRFHTGWPRTPLLVTPVLDGSGNVVGVDPDLTQRNEREYDNYSRIDFRVSRYVPLSRSNLEFYFELFNVFDTANQCCTTNHALNIGPAISVAPTFDDFLPRFPSFGFVWQFGPGARN